MPIVDHQGGHASERQGLLAVAEVERDGILSEDLARAITVEVPLAQGIG